LQREILLIAGVSVGCVQVGGCVYYYLFEGLSC
jgi:hypothetical protein